MRKCPYPDKRDDGTAAMCIDNNHCGCDEIAIKEREEAIIKATIERCVDAVSEVNLSDADNPYEVLYEAIRQLDVKDILESVK